MNQRRRAVRYTAAKHSHVKWCDHETGEHSSAADEASSRSSICEDVRSMTHHNVATMMRHPTTQRAVACSGMTRLSRPRRDWLLE